MTRPQFDIRALLILTVLVSCGLTFAIQTGNWLVALLVTVLLTNVLAVIVALFVYVVVPKVGNRFTSGERVDDE